MKLSDLITDYDGVTLDTGRCIAIFLIVSLVGLQAFSTIRTGIFDPQAFGTGTAAILAAMGVAIFGDNAKRP